MIISVRISYRQGHECVLGADDDSVAYYSIDLDVLCADCSSVDLFTGLVSW